MADERHSLPRVGDRCRSTARWPTDSPCPRSSAAPSARSATSSCPWSDPSPAGRSASPSRRPRRAKTNDWYTRQGHRAADRPRRGRDPRARGHRARGRRSTPSCRDDLLSIDGDPVAGAGHGIGGRRPRRRPAPDRHLRRTDRPRGGHPPDRDGVWLRHRAGPRPPRAAHRGLGSGAARWPTAPRSRSTGSPAGTSTGPSPSRTVIRSGSWSTRARTTGGGWRWRTRTGGRRRSTALTRSTATPWGGSSAGRRRAPRPASRLDPRSGGGHGARARRPWGRSSAWPSCCSPGVARPSRDAVRAAAAHPRARRRLASQPARRGRDRGGRRPLRAPPRRDPGRAGHGRVHLAPALGPVHPAGPDRGLGRRGGDRPGARRGLPRAAGGRRTSASRTSSPSSRC